MNPAAIMKLISLKNKFDKAHPGVSGFLRNVQKSGIPEGSILEVSVQKPDGTSLNTNMKVTAEDMELLETLKEMFHGA